MQDSNITTVMKYAEHQQRFNNMSEKYTASRYTATLTSLTRSC